MIDALSVTKNQKHFTTFFSFAYTRILCKHFENYYFTIAKRVMALSLRDIITGIKTLLCPLLNYLILVGKNTYLRLQKEACKSEYRGFKIKNAKS